MCKQKNTRQNNQQYAYEELIKESRCNTWLPMARTKMVKAKKLLRPHRAQPNNQAQQEETTEMHANRQQRGEHLNRSGPSIMRPATVIRLAEASTCTESMRTGSPAVDDKRLAHRTDSLQDGYRDKICREGPKPDARQGWHRLPMLRRSSSKRFSSGATPLVRLSERREQYLLANTYRKTVGREQKHEDNREGTNNHQM